MRISDWSSDVCSSDLRQPADPIFGVALRPAGGRRYRDPVAGIEQQTNSAADDAAGEDDGLADLLGDGQAVLLGEADGIEHDKVAGIEIDGGIRSEEHTSEIQSLMRTSYAVF